MSGMKTEDIEKWVNDQLSGTIPSVDDDPNEFHQEGYVMACEDMLNHFMAKELIIEDMVSQTESSTKRLTVLGRIWTTLDEAEQKKAWDLLTEPERESIRLAALLVKTEIPD